MKSTQLDKTAMVIQKLLNTIDNLQRGHFKIVIVDDGTERDVTKENIKSLSIMVNMLQSVLDEETKKYLNA